MILHDLWRRWRNYRRRPSSGDIAALSVHLQRDIGFHEMPMPVASLEDQQAVTLTARPPSEVSLYFDCMSRPV